MRESMGSTARLAAAVLLSLEHMHPNEDMRDELRSARLGHVPRGRDFFQPSSMWDPADKNNWREINDPMDLAVRWFMHLSDFSAPHPLSGSALFCALIERLHLSNHRLPACLARDCALCPPMKALTTGGVERGHSSFWSVKGWLSACGPIRHVRTRNPARC